MPKENKQLDKEERSLLLYLETCAVDSFGKVEGVKMNKDDFEIADKWHEKGFVKFGRMLSSEMKREPVRGKTYSHYVILSETAWEAVSQLRKERAKRNENVNLLIEIRR